MLNRILLASAIALSATPAISTPMAADGVTVTTNVEPRARVVATDLNIATPEGVARLMSRVEGAAAELCLTNAVEPLGVRVARAKCYRAAISSGQRQIDAMVAAQNALATTVSTAATAENGR